MRALLIATAIAVAFLAVGVFWLGVGVWGVLTRESALAILLTATVASTAGWLVVLMGARARPDALFGFFGMGIVAKVILLATGGLIAVGTEVAEIDEFAIGAVVVFLVLSFAQMIPVARAIGREYDNSPPGTTGQAK